VEEGRDYYFSKREGKISSLYPWSLFLEVSKDEIDEAQIIYSYLKGSHCSYFTISDKEHHKKTNANLEKALIKLLNRKSPQLSQ
jgi:excinuclease ABC subunit C